MQLKKVGKWNDIPSYMLPEMPPMGTKVVFKIHNIEFTDADGVKRLNQSFSFPATSAIYDEKSRRTIPIGIVVDSDSKGENITFHKMSVRPNATAGTKTIEIGTSVLGDAEYVYLMLCSNRKDNPYATAHAEVLYELQDVKADFLKASKERREKNAAFAHVMALKDSDLADIAILFGITETADLDMVRAQLETIAFDNPTDYMSRVNDDDKEIFAIIKQAFSLGLVYRKGIELRYKTPDVKIIDLSADSDALIPQEYARYIKGHMQGDKILAVLREQVKDSGRKKGGRPPKQASEE